MDWNSCDSYGTTVREDEVKANADVMARDLARYGWKYIVVDIQSYEPNPQGHEYKPGARLSMDEYGRLLPAVKSLSFIRQRKRIQTAGRLHPLQRTPVRIHVMRGIPRQAVAENPPIRGINYHAADVGDRDNFCKWNPNMWDLDTTEPGSQAYYNSIAELYASWGVDFIKADEWAAISINPPRSKR